jgi:hypothetical protein
MYADLGELAAYGFTIGDAAALRAREAETCAACGAPPLEPRASESTVYEWLQRYHPELGALFAGSPAYEEELRRVAWDSRLECTIPIPERLLPRVADRLDDELREFAADRFAFAICGLCRNAPDVPSDALPATQLERYVRVHFEGNAAAAAAQPVWPQAQAFAATIASESRRARVAS